MAISMLKAQQTCSKKKRQKTILIGEGRKFYILFCKYTFIFSYFMQKQMMCWERKEEIDLRETGGKEERYEKI